MQVILADVYGFCFGVRRAIEIAEEAQCTHGRPVDTLGPLIHNAQETRRLENSGVRLAEGIDKLNSEVVIIRTHGAPPSTFEQLHTRGLNIIDATCPFVTKSQRIAANFSSDGYDIVVVGDPNHPEIKGIQGYCQGRFFVIHDEEELAQLPDDLRPGLIAQTTTDEAKFLKIVKIMGNRYADMRVYNTVCSATHERQEAARKLADLVDAVYVVGGRHSSNTTKLAAVSRESCTKVFLIETADEINEEDLKDVQKVGVTAGASTPDWLINQVVERLSVIESKPCIL
ncbi:MAG: 4-hydroxy-3-methylbut-2-enyl diphosphate reductase [Acidobacteriota bacterium]